MHALELKAQPAQSMVNVPEPDAITREQSQRLFHDLKRLNADPGWADPYRYQAFAHRIDAAAEGVPTAVAWAREWLADLDADQARVDALRQQEIDWHSCRDAQTKANIEAGVSNNPRFQAWLDTIETSTCSANWRYMRWIAARTVEFSLTRKGEVSGAPLEEDQAAFTAYIRQWADNNLSERVKSAKRSTLGVSGDIGQ